MEQHSQSAFLSCFFRLLKAEDERYCVLRNYDTLPSHLNGSDLDIAVESGRGKRVIEIANQAAKECNGFPIIAYSGSIYVSRYMGFYEGQAWGVALDVFDKIGYKGVSYLDTNLLIDNAFDYKGIRVADENDALCLALLKELLSNGADRKDYLSEVASIYQQKPDCFDSFQKGVGDKLRKLCDQRQKGDLKQVAQELRREVIQPFNVKHWISRLQNFGTRLKRIFKPAGFTVAILGTDGSGKTTLIDYLRPVLEEAVHNKIDYEHMRPNFLPPLSAAKTDVKKSEGEVTTDPHGKKQSNFGVSLIRLAYYSVDYIAGFWLRTYPKLIVRPKVCVFDRYFYDFIYDPKRMKISLPKWLIKCAFIFAPKPDLVICLVGNPVKIYERKPETSLETVSEHIEYMKSLSTKNGFIHQVDTTTSIEDALTSCINAFANVVK